MMTMMANQIEIDIISAVFGFMLGIFSLLLFTKWERRQEKNSKIKTYTTSPNPIESTESLHWNPLIERRGLGDLITKVNHIAITVADVGKSVSFYVDILGFQQIRRPSFDRHGAWLTMGNIELHLIKGIPAIPPVDNLQVAHIALETFDINEVVRKLNELNIEVRQSLSVTNAQKSLLERKSQSDKTKPTVIQYFFNDPDGYYLELCNCDVLTKFALNNDDTTDSIEYNEGIPNTVTFDVVKIATHWKETVKKNQNQQFNEILKTIPRAKKIDEEKFNNLIKRRQIYGDIVQGFNDDDIKEALLQTNNNVPLTIQILSEIRGDQVFLQPPDFIENGHLTKPEAFIINQN